MFYIHGCTYSLAPEKCNFWDPFKICEGWQWFVFESPDGWREYCRNVGDTTSFSKQEKQTQLYRKERCKKGGKKWLKERRWIKLVHHSTRLFTPTFWYWWLPHPLSLSPILPFLQKEKWKMRGKMTELVQYRLDSTIPFQSALTPPYLPLHSSFSPSQIIHQTLTGSLALSPLTLLV